MKIKSTLTRRQFISYGIGAGGYAAVSPLTSLFDSPEKPEFHIFSKHLQFLNYQDMAAAAAEIGFDGVELSVRPRGHVLPEQVDEDLPQAVQAIHGAGLKAEMIVTAVTNAEEEVHRKVLKRAAVNGIKYYRMGYLRYQDDQPIPAALKRFNKKMQALARFNQELGLKGTYQNHSGMLVGAAIWDIYHLLDNTDPEVLGCQYDIRHAVVEGGQSWPIGLRLIRDRIQSLVLKDFRWEKANGGWKIVNVPIGEGMVDFVAYFKLLKAYGISVPVSIHYEYPLGGANHGDEKLTDMEPKAVFAAMKKDLNTAKELWDKA